MELKEDLQTYLGRAKSGLRAKIEYSIELCRKAAKIAPMYDDEGYLWLGFSGGKDSQALYHIAQLSGVKFKAFFSPTSVDPPEVIRFIRKNYPEVEFTPLKKSIYSEFFKHKCLPTMKIRWCCAEFKEKGGANKVVLVGVRNSESVKRSKRKEVEVPGQKFSGDFDGFNEWSEKRRIKKQKKLAKDKAQFDQFSEHKEQMVTCINGKDKIVVSPIIHWSDDDVWEFLNEVVRVPHCELYDKGRTRIGCIMCPMSKKSQILKDIEEYPHVYEKWVKAIMQLRQEALFNGSTPPKADMEHSQTPQSGIQDTYRLNIGGKWTNCQSDGTRFLPPTCCKNGVEQSESTKLPPPKKKRPLKGLWAANFLTALTANAQPSVRRTTMSR